MTHKRIRFVRRDEDSYYVYEGFNNGPVGIVERWDSQNWQARKPNNASRLFHYRNEAAIWLTL